MFENTQVTGEFRGANIDVTQFCVRKLKTPIGVLPEAILRTSDIIKMHVLDIDGLRT